MAYQLVTLAQLKTSLASKYDNVPFWTAEEARLAINEGLRAWNSITGFWRTRITLTSIPDDNYLPIPGNMAYKSRVEFNGSPLSPTTLVGLDGGQPTWEGETTASSGVPTSPKMWAPVSLDLIVIWPADHIGNTSMNIDGVASTPILVNDADYIDIGQEEHNQLLGYALHTLAFKYGGDFFGATMPLYQSWIKAAGDRNEQFKASSLYRRVINIDLGRDALDTKTTAPASTG